MKNGIVHPRGLPDCAEEELDRIYREGYESIPEKPDLAISQEQMLADVLNTEESRIGESDKR